MTADAGTDKPTEQRIEQVEGGLLPPVLIRDAKPYTLAERMEHHKVPGLSIAVIRDFQVHWVRHYGVRDANTREPVTDSTLFGVGSLSKCVTAAAVLNKAEQDKLDLKADVNDQLVSWKLPENELTRKAAVTPELLLCHGGGLPASPGYAYRADGAPTLLQVLDGEPPAQNRPARVETEPGTAFHYANLGYALLQQLLIDVENKPFPELMNQTIFEPLAMTRSTFEPHLFQVAPDLAASGHMPDGDAVADERTGGPNMGAGGLWTTAADYAKFVIELQLSFHGRSGKVLSRKAVHEMFTPRVADNYGLGVGIPIYGDEKYFGFFGDIRGFFAGYVAHMTDGYGAVVVTNSANGLNLIREIHKSVASAYGWKGYLPEEYETVLVAPDLLDKYLGRYLVNSDCVLSVSRDDGLLFLQMTGQQRTRLYPVAADTFVTRERKGRLVIVTDSAGCVVEAVHDFADDLGRPGKEQRSRRLADDERTPLELLTEGRLADAHAAYRRIHEENPDDPGVTEDRLNMLGYQLMWLDRLGQAIEVFKANIELHPQSWNVYDSMGEAYEASGDTALAIESLEKCLQLKPQNQGAAARLRRLRGEK